MSDYTKTTDFTAKDSLLTGNPSKIVRGSEIDDEFDAIETAIATKADVANDTITGATITGATLTTASITNPTLNTGTLDPNGNEQFTVSYESSAVNHFQIGNKATGTGPTLAATGDDTNVDMLLTAKGNGVVKADGVEVATISGTQTITNKTIAAANNTLTLTTDSVDAITEIAAAIKTGTDSKLVTGTYSSGGDYLRWDAASQSARGTTHPTGDMVGTTATQILTNKSIGDSGGLTITNVPAFHAKKTTNNNQSLTAATWTKLQLGTEVFDNGSNYDAATNFRFVAPVTGYYHFSCGIRLESMPTNVPWALAFYKNGTRIGGTINNELSVDSLALSMTMSLAATDYVEVWVNHYDGGDVIYDSSGTEDFTFFCGHRVG